MDYDVGSVLKKLRKSKKITQSELANNAGVSRTYLSDVENNRYKPSISFLKSISNGLANGNELDYKDIYNSLMNALGYIEEQTTLEQAATEYDNLLELLGNCINGIKSSKLHLISLRKELITDPNENRTFNSFKITKSGLEPIEENISDIISFHENRINEDKTFITKLITRKTELEKIMQEEIRVRSLRVDELLKEIEFL